VKDVFSSEILRFMTLTDMESSIGVSTFRDLHFSRAGEEQKIIKKETTGQAKRNKSCISVMSLSLFLLMMISM
jgi:hypothetical protein